MTAALFVVVAAAATLARALLTAKQPAGKLPWRTLAVNAAGSFLLGLVFGGEYFGSPVITASAGLGSFTTFSTVAAETASLLDNGRRGRAIAYVGLSVVVGIAAAWLGLTIGDPR